MSDGVAWKGLVKNTLFSKSEDRADTVLNIYGL
jgi:hypothetical protein